MEKIFNKLVRDRIPEIIESNNEIAYTRILNEDEYKTELEKKLLEEYNEVMETKTGVKRLEELADMLEVIVSLIEIENKTLDEVLEIMKQKGIKRGRFSNRIFLERTSTK